MIILIGYIFIIIICLLFNCEPLTIVNRLIDISISELDILI